MTLKKNEREGFVNKQKIPRLIANRYISEFLENNS